MAGPSILDEQVKAFSRAAALWRPEDTRGALACRDLEDRLRVGLYLYEQFDAEDREWRLAMARGAKYDRAREARIERQFAWWLRPCLLIEKRIAHFEAGGTKVEHAAEFRRYHGLARRAVGERRTPTA